MKVSHPFIIEKLFVAYAFASCGNKKKFVSWLIYQFWNCHPCCIFPQLVNPTDSFNKHSAMSHNFHMGTLKPPRADGVVTEVELSGRL